jgi:hypothetical protein
LHRRARRVRKRRNAPCPLQPGPNGVLWSGDSEPEVRRRHVLRRRVRWIYADFCGRDVFISARPRRLEVAAAELDLIGEIRASLLVLRLAIASGLAIASHHLEWIALRTWLTDSIVALSTPIGIVSERIQFDLIIVENTALQFVIGCTSVDYFAWSIPFVWSIDGGRAKNIARVAIFFCALMVLNVARLELGVLAFARGAPWWLAHDVVSGLWNFGIVVFALRCHARASRATTTRGVSSTVSLGVGRAVAFARGRGAW